MLWHVSPLHRISGSAWMMPTEIPQSDTKTTFWSTLAARLVATVLGKTRQPSVESQWGNYASSPPVGAVDCPSNSGGEAVVARHGFGNWGNTQLSKENSDRHAVKWGRILVRRCVSPAGRRAVQGVCAWSVCSPNFNFWVQFNFSDPHSISIYN